MIRAGLKLSAAVFFLLALLVVPSRSKLHAQQQQNSGVVTAVEGQAQLTRPNVQQPATLRQKDNVFIRDVIDTREKSSARMLFGGKATVTVRELSRFEVREETIAGGGTRSTVQVNSGAVLINVARDLMKPGDEVVVRTGNAIAAIRGSMIYAEATKPDQSTFAQLAGEASLQCAPGPCPPVTLTRFTATDVNGSNIAPLRQITEEFAALLLRTFELPRTVQGEGNRNSIVNNGFNDVGTITQAALGTTTTGVGFVPLPPPPPPPTKSNLGTKLPPPCRTDCGGGEQSQAIRSRPKK
jgi:hypothetical protein